MLLRSNSKVCITLLIPAVLFVAGGCSSVSLPSMPWSGPAVQPDANAEALYQEGMGYLKNKSYLRAIDRLQRVKTEFPFSPQLTDAELKLAEAYYLNKQYPEAVSAFKEFQTMHPSNENIPFVVYHLGLAHFDQFGGIDRDQKVTEIAKGYFEDVTKKYPSSPYASLAKEKVAKCLEYLAEHEFYIASFYVREKKYPAARDRFEQILRRYPDTPTAIKSLYQLGESYRLEKNNVKAALAYEALIQRYPDSPFSRDARVQLAAVEKEKQDPLQMLLMRDGRPASVPPPNGGETSTASTQKSQELNLVEKKEVVYEEPGVQRGMFSRILDTLNPFSSSDKKENGAQKVEARNQVETTRDPQLVNKIDESLKQKGISDGSQNLASSVPTSDLPKVEEQTAPGANTGELVGQIDETLKKEGKDGSALPPTPEIAAVLKTPTTEASKSSTAKVETPAPQSESAAGVIANIDEALKRKGIEPAKLEPVANSKEPKPQGQESDRQPSGANIQQKIQLDTKLVPEKGPFLLESGEYQLRDNASPAEQEKASAPTEKPEQPKGLPRSVVTGPPSTARDKAPEAKATEKKPPSPDEEQENKNIMDQIKEDIGRLRGLLNPLEW
jgi:outer membrane protein assembly factor BamD